MISIAPCPVPIVRRCAFDREAHLVTCPGSPLPLERRPFAWTAARVWTAGRGLDSAPRGSRRPEPRELCASVGTRGPSGMGGLRLPTVSCVGAAHLRLAQGSRRRAVNDVRRNDVFSAPWAPVWHKQQRAIAGQSFSCAFAPSWRYVGGSPSPVTGFGNPRCV